MPFSLATIALLSLASTTLAAPAPFDITVRGIKLSAAAINGTTNGTAKATPTASASSSAAPAATTPTLFTGDGSVGQGWPSKDSWATYDTILANNQKILGESCTQFQKDNNTPDEIKDIDSSIQSVAKTTNMDPRFILAIVMQESKGCVRVHDTISPDGTVRNPGLMQDHNGPNSCANTPVPCPPATITGMIMDGTNGTVGITGGGDGLVQTLAQATGDKLTDAQAFYAAAKIYNSGSYTPGSNLSVSAATSSYASDVANRLLGVAF
jgi:hypothetical protein